MDTTAEKPSNALLWIGVATALLAAPLAIIPAIVLFAKNRVGPGIAVLMLMPIGIVLSIILGMAAAA